MKASCHGMQAYAAPIEHKLSQTSDLRMPRQLIQCQKTGLIYHGCQQVRKFIPKSVLCTLLPIAMRRVLHNPTLHRNTIPSHRGSWLQVKAEVPIIRARAFDTQANHHELTWNRAYVVSKSS